MGKSPLLSHDRAGSACSTFLGLCKGKAIPGPGASIPGAERGESDFRLGGLELSARCAEAGQHAAQFALEVHNRAQAPIRLAALRFCVLWTPGEAGSLALLCQSSGSEGLRPADSAGWSTSELVAVAGTAKSGGACLVGVVEGDAARGRVHARESDGGVCFEADLQLEGALRAGETLRPGSVRVALGVDPQLLLEEYAEVFGRDAAARVTRPFLASALLGGLGAEPKRSFLHHLEDLSASRAQVEFDAVVVGAEAQRETGDWLSDAWRGAPSVGMQVEEIRGAGFIPGLRVSPFCVGSRSQLVGEHPEWLLEGAGHIPPEEATRDVRSGEVLHALDASHPEFIAHLERVGAELAALGFGFIQLDSLDLALRSGSFAREDLFAAARLRGALDALRRGLGEEVFLLGARAPLGVGVGALDALRVAPTPIESSGPARSASAAAVEMLDRVWMHRRLFINDLGGFTSRWEGRPLDAHERSALLTAWSTAGSLQLVDEFGALDAAARDFLGRVVERARGLDSAGIPGTPRLRIALAAGHSRHFEAEATDGTHVGDVNAGNAVVKLGETRFAKRSLLHVGEDEDPAAPPEDLAPQRGSLCFVERAAPLAVFCDFDGTFSVQDVGSTLAKRHAGAERPKAWARYERGEITPWEYNMQILHGLEIPVAELDRFLREEIDLDPGARRLLAWCEAHEVSFRILSDGFDWNLMRLQAIHGFRVSCASNHLHYDRGRWSLRAGAPDASCGCGTGLCKSAVIRRYREANPGRRLVHIGNGRVSDSCGAVEADQAFAKDSLAEALRARGEPFLPFETLDDVIPALEDMLSEC